MDKLKENGFTLAASGVVVVLLATAWFLVVSPYFALGAKAEEVDKTRSQLSSYAKKDADQPVPTQEVVRRRRSEAAQAQTVLQDAEDFYAKRAGAFQKFFGDIDTAPPRSTFYTTYFQQHSDLLKQYQEKYPIETARERETDEPYPEVRNAPDPSAQGSDFEPAVAMKMFWITQAIVGACIELDIGGLKEIDFEQAKSRSRSRDAAEAESPYIHSYVDVKIVAEMPYSKLTDFLGALYSSPRVPFVDATKVEMRKIPEELVKFEKARREVKVEADGGGLLEFEDVIEEPPVSVTLQLRALDWKGPRPKPEGTEPE